MRCFGDLLKASTPFPSRDRSDHLGRHGEKIFFREILPKHYAHRWSQLLGHMRWTGPNQLLCSGRAIVNPPSPTVSRLPSPRAYRANVLIVGLGYQPFSNRLNVALSIPDRSAKSPRLRPPCSRRCRNPPMNLERRIGAFGDDAGFQVAECRSPAPNRKIPPIARGGPMRVPRSERRPGPRGPDQARRHPALEPERSYKDLFT